MSLYRVIRNIFIKSVDPQTVHWTLDRGTCAVASRRSVVDTVSSLNAVISLQYGLHRRASMCLSVCIRPGPKHLPSSPRRGELCRLSALSTTFQPPIPTHPACTGHPVLLPPPYSTSRS